MGRWYGHEAKVADALRAQNQLLRDSAGKWKIVEGDYAFDDPSSADRFDALYAELKSLERVAPPPPDPPGGAR